MRFINKDHHGGLHKAVLNGSESEVESLISAGKGKLKIKNFLCPTVLRLAIIICNFKIAVCKPIFPSSLPSGQSVGRSVGRSVDQSVDRSVGRSVSADRIKSRLFSQADRRSFICSVV